MEKVESVYWSLLFTYDLKQLESSEELIDQRNIVFLSVPKRGL